MRQRHRIIADSIESIDRSTTDIHKLVFPSTENGSIVSKLDIFRIVRFWGWEVNSLAFEKK